MKNLLVILGLFLSISVFGQQERMFLGVNLAQEDKQLHIAGGAAAGFVSDVSLRLAFPKMKPWKRVLWNVVTTSVVIFGKEGYDHLSGKGVASWADVKAGYMGVTLVGWTWTLKSKKNKPRYRFDGL